MCRRSKIRCGGFIYLAFFFTLVLGLTAGQARGQHRAAYWDGRYRTWWADDAITIIIRDDFEAAGYTILDADELKTWMDARIDDEATSVVVFCRDNAPDTVVESISDNCTLRRYLDAGGKIVWYSDVPVWDLAHSDGSFTYLGGAGCANILGITGVDWTNSTGSQATLTDDGIDWGLTETWRSERWTPANQVDIILASDRAGNAAAWVKHFVTGDTTGGFVRIWDIDVTPDNRPSFEDLLAVAEYGMESNPYALAPNPTDGVLLTGFIGGILGTSLSWKRGDCAVSHNVYFGDDFDAVNDGTGGTFQRNQTDTYFYVGYGTLGDPLPGGFVPGTTYYWRIDEVNDTDPNSPWKGNVWSLEVADTKAYAPTPVEGSKFINPNVNLSWESGLGMTMQTAYFGEDYDTVDSATAEDGTLVGVATTYDPGPLEYDTVYYWHVDTGGAYGQIKGDVWSFKTAKEGGGIKGEYFNNMDLSGSPVLTRIDPEINFYWNRGPVVRGVLEDGFSVRWTGELEAAFSEPVTFITGSDDGVRLYLGGELIIENWTDHSRTEDKSEPIELVEGQTYTIVLEGYENAGEAEWQLYWESPSIPRQIIPQAALSPPIKAGSPNPPNGATGERQGDRGKVTYFHS